MTIANLPFLEWAAALLVGLNPFRGLLAYLPIAKGLPEHQQRELAWRAVRFSFVLALAIIVAGGAILGNLGIRTEVLVVSAGIAFVVKSFSMLSVQPTDRPAPPRVEHPMRLATSPLAVPGIVSPAGVAALFILSATATSVGQAVAVSAVVAAIMAINLALMLSLRRGARRLTLPILEVIVQVFGLLILALGVSLVLEGLGDLGLIRAI